MVDREPLIEIAGVTKDYRSLRPLRVQHLVLHEGESIALLGFDAAMSEVLVNMITGAQLPDQGEIRVFGRPTSSITAVDDWVTELDRFGLISTRAVLVDQFTAEQNLALPLTLEIDPLPETIRTEVSQLASEVGLSNDELALQTGALAPSAQLRLRVGRALALRPRVLLAEHPTASLSLDDATQFAVDFSSVITQRGIAVLMMTLDPHLRNVADRVLELVPATGVLNEKGLGWRRWFF
jgi:putative ABC transport system ATP-binding protein